MRYLLSLILIGASLGLFFVYTNPAYMEVKNLRTEQASYNEALDNSKKLQAVRDTLVTKYNGFSPTTLDRLTKLLPDNVDNIKLILEINLIAEQYGMQIRNIKYDVAKKETPATNQFVAQAPTAQAKDYSDFDLEFSIEGSYANFVNFLSSLETSLRIVDVQSISFSSTETTSSTGVPTGNYKYDFKIKTYWLKG